MEQKIKRKVNLLVILSVALLGLLLFVFFQRPTIQFVEGDRVFEKGTVIKAEDLIKKVNGTVTVNPEYVYTDEVGKYSISYDIQKRPFLKHVEYSYEVVDTTPPKIEVKEDVLTFDIDELFSQEDLLNNLLVDEGTITIDTDYVFDTIGSYDVHVIAEDLFGNQSNATYEIEVKDMDSPIIFYTGSGAQIEKGSEFQPLEFLSFGDNVDVKPTLKIEGEVDTSKVGSYPLHGILTDSSGNEKDWFFTVEVVERKKTASQKREDYPFDWLKQKYQQVGRQFGIDISEWQGDIDFQKVKDAGCDFAMIRIGFSHNGELRLDKKYYQNIKGAQEVGIPFGIYLFCYDNTEEELRSSLNQVFEELDGMHLDLPIAFDWENFENYQDYEINFLTLNQYYDIFEEEVTKHGYESMLYATTFCFEKVWTNIENRCLWVAQYNDWPTLEVPFRMWQVTASGKIDGIQGQVDLNVLMP